MQLFIIFMEIFNVTLMYHKSQLQSTDKMKAKGQHWLARASAKCSLYRKQSLRK